MSVYVITDGSNAVKIGSAADVQKRIKTLQIGNPRTLTVLMEIRGRCSDLEVERALHNHFAEYQIKNKNSMKSEWFRKAAYEKLKNMSEEEIDIIVHKESGQFQEVKKYKDDIINKYSAEYFQRELTRKEKQIERMRAEIRNKRNTVKEMEKDIEVYRNRCNACVKARISTE